MLRIAAFCLIFKILGVILMQARDPPKRKKTAISTAFLLIRCIGLLKAGFWK